MGMWGMKDDSSGWRESGKGGSVNPLEFCCKEEQRDRAEDEWGPRVKGDFFLF